MSVPSRFCPTKSTPIPQVPDPNCRVSLSIPFHGGPTLVRACTGAAQQCDLRYWDDDAGGWVPASLLDIMDACLPASAGECLCSDGTTWAPVPVQAPLAQPGPLGDYMCSNGTEWESNVVDHPLAFLSSGSKLGAPTTVPDPVVTDAWAVATLGNSSAFSLSPPGSWVAGGNEEIIYAGLDGATYCFVLVVNVSAGKARALEFGVSLNNAPTVIPTTVTGHISDIPVSHATLTSCVTLNAGDRLGIRVRAQNSETSSFDVTLTGCVWTVWRVQ